MFRTRISGSGIFSFFVAASSGIGGQAVQPVAGNSGSALRTAVGVVVSLKGPASWRSNSSAPEQPLDKGRKLYPGEAVRCISTCVLKIRLFETDVDITEKSGWYPIPKAADEGTEELRRGGRFAQFLPAPAGSGERQRVAVLDFDYGAVHGSVKAIFGANQDIGKGLPDLLTQRLMADGTYSVIDRKAVDKILHEQSLSNSDLADSTTVAKLGRILGVDMIIAGSVTEFGPDDAKRIMGRSGTGGLTSMHGWGGVSNKNSKAVVAMTTRMINTHTAEVLAAVTARGESSRSGTSLVGSGGSWAKGGAGGIDMGSSDFANTILGEAVNQAVANAAHGLDSEATKLPDRKAELNGLVADVSGPQLVINIGRKGGVKVGDHLEVRRKQRELTDPATGKVLRVIEYKVGEVVIANVDEQSSAGRYSGSGEAKVGDAVRREQ